MRGRLAAVVLAAALLEVSGGGAPRAGAAAAAAAPIPVFAGPTALAAGDFDGDGRDDLAVGVPREDAGAKVDAGLVHVFYGTRAGLATARTQMWTQAGAAIPGDLDAGDGFGWALATGDFDGDGYDDLAIGAPLETMSARRKTLNGCCIVVTFAQAGAVNVFYGSRAGLGTGRAQLWHQGQPGVKGERESNDFFGAALAAGDFDGDGRDELAVGVPGENDGAGAVQVLTGGKGGLSASDRLWLQDSKDVDDASERGDGFGSSLAAGNLGYSTKEADLAIGIPGEDLGSAADAGAVAILYGQPGHGLTATIVPDRFLHQDAPGVDDAGERRDMFGAALAIGDFGRTTHGDLAVGVPGEEVSVPRQGAVQVFYGSSYGVNLDGEQLWYQGGGLQDAPRPAAEVGRSLVAASFRGGRDDLAIGAPYAGIHGLFDSTAGAGNVHVVYGAPGGLAGTGSTSTATQVWHRAKLLPSDPTLAGELFGFALAAGDFDGGGDGDDLAASAPNAWAGAGFFQLVHGGPVGLTAAGSERWHQDAAGVPDEREPGDRLGGG